MQNMNWTPELKTFVVQHLMDDTDRLLLSAHRFPNIDVREAVEQIHARRQVRNKLPEWYVLDDIIYGGRVPAEQCSSEQTARYKRQLVVGESLCDLTGGMGVDFYYMSQGLKRAFYTERQPHLVEALRHNLPVLYGSAAMPDFELRQGDGRDLPIPDADTLYLDPARRASDGSRVYDLTDCEPDVVQWQEELRRHCKKLIVKISPMADITKILTQLQFVTDVHVVAVRNECKEILVEIKGDREVSSSYVQDVHLHCVDYRSNDTLCYDFMLGEERMASVDMIDNEECRYFYEPDVTLMKAAVFRQICDVFSVKKVDANSHFYMSDSLKPDFPGRTFEVDEVMPFSSKLMKGLKKNIPQANITARNFPLTADQLRSRMGIRDGGDVYLFATTFRTLGNVLLRCHKLVLACIVLLMIGIAHPAFARKKNKQAIEPTLVEMLSHVQEHCPFEWLSGKPFIYVGDKLSQVLVPETVLEPSDTLGLCGSIWRFDAIVSEEDWMGQQKMQLRFVSPSGKAFRFHTERLLSQRNDTAYHPVLGPLQPYESITLVDSLLRSRSLYILINDERILGHDESTLQKFVPVRIDSVTMGTELAPLRVWFTQGEEHASFIASMPNSRENRTSTSIERYLSVADPYAEHFNITTEVWELIQKSMIRRGMTAEEVKLSIGRPLRFERIPTRNGLSEYWYYSNGRILEIYDGRLQRIGREK